MIILIHKPDRQASRLEKKLVLSIVTLFRKKLGKPVDPDLREPKSLATEVCLEYLRFRASQSEISSQASSSHKGGCAGQRGQGGQPGGRMFGSIFKLLHNS